MKKEKGSITLYVLIACIFFVVILSIVYTNMVHKKQAQEENIAQIQANYAKNLSTTITEESDLSEIIAKIQELENKNNEMINQIEELKKAQGKGLEDIYPIGSIYISTDLTTASQVAAKFGGTWENYGEGRTLLGTTTKSGVTGGNSEIKLATSNIPTLTTRGKTSSLNVITSTNGNHNHDIISKVAGFDGWPLKTVSDYTFNYLHFYNAGTETNKLNYVGKDNTPSYSNPSGDHSHTVTIPEQDISTIYTNNSQTNINVQNPYITVFMWKRVS